MLVTSQKSLILFLSENVYLTGKNITLKEQARPMAYICLHNKMTLSEPSRSNIEFYKTY